MSVMDTVQLLEQRTQKAATLIAMLRKEKADLQEKLNEAQGRPVADPETERKLQEALASVATLQEQVTASDELAKKLQAELDEAKRQIEELQQRLTLANTHNEELQSYISKYEESNKLIEESISKSLETLSGVQGLDDIPLDTMSNQELEAADDFTRGGALGGDQVDESNL
ncbi:MAG: hypothetical protein LKE39_06030 [Sphaerochaeta sp.]|jgi:chromosome segregation ATPase|nr:hypothetical protein [Sphaerochaeta sp.]MCH3920018.1 hypothetical protein [Sphaerochaeta sp.]MCI2045277.1 hypothetical protein [Sphaerochaeta sp.]